ncbi:FAD-binding oxidoreductase [Pleionea sp. CnH1-48]|uniref:FAD-binding oxidoreductase n=1 Tax=Pleionea sp. CnH1-48 TaxID=2954494 RepID=UPI0020972275|nr:FAD-binding oxidoreductase [Pleionea sp. CnH1-48]MCO7225220.1 FAD-binding oxidoreductase [Pleionea sp. CnH1-48]
MKIYHLSCLMLFPLMVKSAELAPFTTDGCSAFPDGTLKENQLWLGCCIAHDRDYWAGGTKEERKQSDKRLEQCVSQLGKEKLSKIMYMGVRLGGTPFLPTSFRWGYGWSESRGYKPLTETEQKLVEQAWKRSDYYQHNPQKKSQDKNSKCEPLSIPE